jgi:hypothetical protein
MPCVLDAAHLAFTTSGRAAIALALRALRVGAGDSVLVPTYHCPTMIAPVVAAGASPVFFPIDGNGGPCLDALDRLRPARLRAMIAAHYFGLPQPMSRLRAFCDSRGIALIEDCAHALFGIAEDRPVGGWGDFAIASLTKFLPVMDGGCLVCPAVRRDSSASIPVSHQIRNFANAIEIGASYGRLRGLNTLVTQLFEMSGRFRKSTIEPAVENTGARGADATKWLADFEPASDINRGASWWTRSMVMHAHRGRIVELRRRNYLELVRLVKDIGGVRALSPSLPDEAVPYVFPLLVDEPAAIYQATRASGIPVFRWDEIWPTCPVIPEDHGRTWATHIFQIGCHQDLRLEDLNAIATTLHELVDSHRQRRPSSAYHASPTSGDALRRA